jgi:metal-responsive CopG/Arc/MetJ family transcriptional regulator
MSDSMSHARTTKNETDMQRVTFRAEETLIDDLDQLVEDGEFPNRSAALRAAARQVVAGGVSDE